MVQALFDATCNCCMQHVQHGFRHSPNHSSSRNKQRLPQGTKGLPFAPSSVMGQLKDLYCPCPIARRTSIATSVEVIAASLDNDCVIVGV